MVASPVTRPFLKWAGGKRQLLPVLRRFYPKTFNAYFEPFLGSGAVFFDLHTRGLLADRVTTLTDSNADLIACYTAVRDHTEEIIGRLLTLARDHDRLGPEHYYDVRNERFNPGRRALVSGVSGIAYTPSLAAMFIYLNRTGYNGLFRLNAAGEFNVPAGRYSTPRICDPDNLRRVAAALRQPAVTLRHLAFDDATQNARAGDFLYFDPPYAPLSSTARFTTYTAGGFSQDDQERLRDVSRTLASRGCYVVMSNSTAPEIAELYSRNAAVAAAGLVSHTVPARRAINSNAGRRGVVEEYVITNVPETRA